MIKVQGGIGISLSFDVSSKKRNYMAQEKIIKFNVMLQLRAKVDMTHKEKRYLRVQIISNLM